MTAETTHNRADPETVTGRDDRGVGFIVGPGWRLDAISFRRSCLLSEKGDGACQAPAAGAAAIPDIYRPRLQDILNLLKKCDAWQRWPLSKMGPERKFTLRPVDGHLLEPDAASTVLANDAVAAREYRVVGFLGLSVAKAAARLASRCGFDPADWLGPPELFRFLTTRDAKWLKRVPSTVNLTAPDPDRPALPVVSSERFAQARSAAWKGLLRPECTAVQLKGVAGTGKSSLIRMLADEMISMRVPARLQAHLLVSLNTEVFMESYFAFEESIKTRLRSEMARRRIIWVIDEASRLVARGETAALDNLLLFIDQGAKVILSSDQAHLLEKREAFMRRLSPVYLPPAERKEVQAVVTARAEHLAKETGLSIRPEAVASAVDLSYGASFAQPHAAVTLLGNTVAASELTGENEVTGAHVEKELRAMFSQGAADRGLPATVGDFIERVRAEGFRGHDGTLRVFSRGLLRSLRRRFRPGRPPGPVWSCVFAGAPAVGKNMLAGIAGRMITGTERKVKQIDCNFYQSDHAFQSLVGSPMSYVGYGEGGVLQNFIKQNPDGVLIFKKPELGHPNILKILNGILAGEFTAGDGQHIPTGGLMVFVTTGAGAKRPSVGFGTGTRRQGLVLDKEFHDIFPSGLEVYLMEALEPAALRNILRLELNRYARAEGVAIEIEEAVLDILLGKVNTRLEGARGALAAYRQSIEPLLDRQLESRKSCPRLTLCLDKNRQIVCRSEDQPPVTGGGSGSEGSHHGK